MKCGIVEVEFVLTPYCHFTASAAWISQTSLRLVSRWPTASLFSKVLRWRLSQVLFFTQIYSG